MLTLFKVLYFVESAAYIRAKLLAKSSARPTRAGFKTALLFAKHTNMPWKWQYQHDRMLIHQHENMAICKYATANCNGKFAYQYWTASTVKNLRERERKK